MTTRTKKLLARLQKVECPDTTYIAEDFPIVMKRANGMWVHDVNNNRYLDFTACFGVLALGHRSKVTLRTLRKQSAKLIHGMGDVHPSEPKIKLLELLAQITPYTHAQSILGQSGGDAVEAALKTSILATNRSLFLSFAGGYHGLQFAPLSLNDNPLFTHGFESWLKEKNVSLPFPQIDSEEHVLEKIEDELKKKLYAALILEPIQGRGGMREFSNEFIRQCRQLSHKYGTLLIFDEIFTGFGRTGKMFAWEHSEVIPDLLCVGKGMGGGLPLSACVGNILDVWGKSKGEARHTQTFLGHPLACAVAYETIKEIQKKLPVFQKELIKIDAVFNKFHTKINQSHATEKSSFQIRGKGFMRGLWFYNQKENFGATLMKDLLKKGYLVLPSGPKAEVLSLTPPLIAKASHYKNILDAIGNII